MCKGFGVCKGSDDVGLCRGVVEVELSEVCEGFGVCDGHTTFNTDVVFG